MSAYRLRFLHRGTPTPTPTPTPSGSVTYDTSIGNGVNSNGVTSLPLRAGAKRFYVNSSTGSDSNTSTQAQSAATPLATVAKAVSFCVDGEGDQVLVAQGTTYPRGLAYVGEMGGFSPTYPFVIQSYDPADPTNEAKMGTATGSNRPVLDTWNGADMASGFISGGPTEMARLYRAFRGLEFNPGNVAEASLTVYRGGGGNTPDYLLFENMVFAYQALTFAFAQDPEPSSAIRATHMVVRNSAFYGQWDSLDQHTQGLYVEFTDGTVIEDCVFWHNGWKTTATRSTASNLGGPTIYNHPIYAQQDTTSTVVRRCVFIDSATDGGELKGGGIYQNNLSLNNPIGVFLGLHENEYSVLAPLGVYVDASYNAIIGGDGSQDWGIEVCNSRPQSLAHHNVLAHALNMVGYGLMADAGADAFGVTLPNYITYDRNVTYQWTGSGVAGSIAATGISSDAGASGFIHATYTNNLWDEPTSGSNTVNTGHSWVNAYTADGLAVGLGYADLATARADWLLHPDQHSWRNGTSLALTGYTVTVPALSDLTTDLRVTVGIPTSGLFIGTQDGTVLTWSGAPTGFTISSDGRRWNYDGTGSATSGSLTVTETGASSNHTTTLSYAVYARPVLSGVSATPSTTTATAAVSTNVGSGSIFWTVGTLSTPTDIWPYIRAGRNYGLGTTGIAAHGSQAVSSSGSQPTINISGLVHATVYYLNIVQLDANNNPSLTTTYSFTTS